MEHPDGSTEYRYLVDDLPAAVLVPPKGFDATTASKEQLEKFGIPTDPPDDPELRKWDEVLKKLHFVDPPEELHGIPVQAAAHSGSWAGWAVSGATFSSADMAYLEPGDRGTTCAGDAAVFWTGLGGLGNYPLVQDGTALAWPMGLRSEATHGRDLISRRVTG